MADQRTREPETYWKELIDDFGDDHGPLTPGLSDAFSNDSYSLMWAVSWFKFAGKMIGNGHSLVFDPLEGLGGWTVACETGSVVSVLKQSDLYHEVRASWPDKRIVFKKSEDPFLNSESLFDGIVCFDLQNNKNPEEWAVFLKKRFLICLMVESLLREGVQVTYTMFLKPQPK